MNSKGFCVNHKGDLAYTSEGEFDITEWEITALLCGLYTHTKTARTTKGLLFQKNILLTCYSGDNGKWLLSIPPLSHKLLISGYSWWVIEIIQKVYMGICIFEKNSQCYLSLIGYNFQ